MTLNLVLRFDAEPLPDIDTIFACLGRARYFSKLDLSKGYWQIPMANEDKPRTAFTTPSGQYQWLTMPFGLKTAGAIFSRVMREVLRPIQDPDLHNFMDDVLAGTSTWTSHAALLKKLFQCLQEVNMSARPKKCQLGYQEIGFLGHSLSVGMLSLEEDKVAKVSAAKPPSTKKELRSFLGLAGFYRRFIPNFASLALPLTENQGKVPHQGGVDRRMPEGIDSLKQALTAKPVLVLPDASKPFVLRTDASGEGLGAVLMQEKDGMLRPVAYASKKLTGAETRYHTTEQECLAVVWGVRRFYPYLYGRSFTLQSDHNPLQYLHKIRPVSRRLMAWAMELQSYAYTFQAIKGCDNVGADYLSRSTQ